MRVFLAFALSLILLAGATYAEEPTKYIKFHHIKDPALLKFAVSFYQKRNYDEFKGKRGLQLLRKELEVFEADIDDDGVPELFLLLEDIGYCGTAGCEAQIFKKTATGYELICETSLASELNSGTGSPILPETEHGFHRIEAPEAIIHWNEHKGPPEGNLCWHENLND